MKLHKFLILRLLFICGQTLLQAKALVLPNLYPFGASEGDLIVPENDDGSSGQVAISIPFPFFDQYQTSLFVNTNGVISFLVQVSQFTPDSFPLGDNRRLVAPFWADVDTRVAGQVFFRETSDPGLLQQASDDVRANYLKYRNFQASWLLIATWYEVGFFGARGIHRNKTNTFQAVLITNGRHSFVTFNYNKLVWTTGTAEQSGGNSSGLGGIPAQAGFNAGDGVRYFNIPGSRTNQVLDLIRRTNVGVSGRWMFHIDRAKIEGSGCNTKGSLVLSPSTGIMLGGENILISGPCYNSLQHIVCEFHGQTSNGRYISAYRSSCTVPMFNFTGRIALKMSINGGRNFDFQGIFTIVNINRFTPRVTRLELLGWREQNRVAVEWNPDNLGPENQRVKIQLARFFLKDDRYVSFHSMFTLVEDQLNTGEAIFEVPMGQGRGEDDESGGFITLVTVERIGDRLEEAPAERIWSDVFYLIDHEFAGTRCEIWYEKQPDPKIYTDDASLLSCPQTLAQAMADRGRFMFDEYCNPAAPSRCFLYHEGIKHCFRTNIPSDNGTGQECCYSEEGNLIVGQRIGGSLDRVHIKAGVPVLSHYFHDLVPYWDCCILAHEYCEYFFEKRPSNDGSYYDPPRPAITFSDPQIITLDRVEYTFNGYGEYHILRVTGPQYELQGRMQPLLSETGNLTRATVYKAFAMEENGADIVQVHINGRNEIELLVNGDIMEFEEQSMIDFNGVTIIKYNNTSKHSVIFNSGISATVEKVDDILQLMLLVPSMFRGNTSGLLGFWDGNKEQEFLLPNGSFIDTNSSQSRIHYEFGKLWATTANDSLFTYEEGKNHASYFHAAYVPLFLDEQDFVFNNATLGQQAREVCGNNRQCLFDIYTTGKVSIGMASKQAVESFISLINVTDTLGCIPIKNTPGNGTVIRNDTSDGIVIFTFRCNLGFVLNGSSVISCSKGQWNGTQPSCEKLLPVKQKEIQISEKKRNAYIVGAVSGTAVCVLAAAVIVVTCVLVRNRRKRYHVNDDQNPSPSETCTKQAFSSDNPGYVSSDKAA